MFTVIPERLEKINGLHLKAGSHSPNSTFCVMEAVAYVAGEKWSEEVSARSRLYQAHRECPSCRGTC